MRIKTDVVLLLLCLSVPCFGQVKVPDTPAGQKFSAWLEAFNRGDHAAYQQFLEQNYPSRKQDADQAMAFREMTVASWSHPRQTRSWLWCRNGTAINSLDS